MPMGYEDPPRSSVRIIKKEPPHSKDSLCDRSDHSLFSQMSAATTATVQAILRGLQNRDAAALVQATKNGRIVQELFEQENPPLRRNESEEEIRHLADNLQEIASLAASALQNDDQQLQIVLESLPSYVETILDDITASPTRLFFLASKERPSRKKLPELQNEVILAMAASSSPETIRAGMALVSLLERLKSALPKAERLCVASSIPRTSDQS